MAVFYLVRLGTQSLVFRQHLLSLSPALVLCAEYTGFVFQDYNDGVDDMGTHSE